MREISYLPRLDYFWHFQFQQECRHSQWQQLLPEPSCIQQLRMDLKTRMSTSVCSKNPSVWCCMQPPTAIARVCIWNHMDLFHIFNFQYYENVYQAINSNARIHHCRLKLHSAIEIWIAGLGSSYSISVFTITVCINQRIENWKSRIENLELSQSTKIGWLKSQTSNRDLKPPIEIHLFFGDVFIHHLRIYLI